MSDKYIKEDEDVKENEDINLDFSKIKKFFSSKIFHNILLILLLLIPIILTIYIRFLPQSIPATDSWAQSSVDNYYKNNIAQQINSQYPNLPTTQKQKLIDDQYNQFKQTNKDQITAQVAQTSQYFKTGFQYQENNNTYTFLGDLDSYFYLRYARNYEEKGYVCDAIVNGKCWDTHMIAPLGIETTPTMHPLATAYLYKILHFFDKKINLMQSAFILPTILAIIAAIAAFFIGRKLMNDVGGFFASMFVALSPLFITRTLGSDTDAWNIMFPLLIILVFIYAFESKSLIKRIILSSFAGLLMGLFCFAWSSGWWYIFDFLMATILAYIVYELLKGYIKYKRKHATKIWNKELTNTSIMFATLLVSSIIFITLIVSFSSFTDTWHAPLSMFNGLKAAAHENLWPNVYTTVAELNEANIATIISQISFGLIILFPIALLGIIFMVVKRKPDFKDYLLIGISLMMYIFLTSTKAMNMNIYLYLILLVLPIIAGLLMLLQEKESLVDIKMALLLTIWFVGMIFSSIKGVRFILLLTPAFAIALGVAIGYIYQYLVRVFNDSFNMKEIIAKLLVFIILCIILIAPIQVGIAAGKSYVPSMTTGWWDSLTKIRNESKPDAIINSWWDFGHWFKYVADRGATLDGAIQNHPNAYWLGKLLQTSSEKETLSILRMLDCGSNNAFEEINKKYQDTEKSQNVISEVISLDATKAKEYLQTLGYTNSEIETILKDTHCNPPEDYLITSEDMVGKAGVWAHFGLWDFDKAYIINEVKPKSLAEGTRLMKERFNYSDEEATKIYYDVQTLTTDREMNDWIAPWPSYAAGSIPCTNYSDVVLCDMRITIGNNGQQNIVLERAVINLTNPEDSQVLMGVYSQSTNARVGENIAKWSKVVIADKKIKSYELDNATLNLGILLNIETTNNITKYNAIISDKLLTDSTFTKLFYLEGKGMEHFEKFSDVTDITGTRIIVWKVKW